ncbi:MAG: DUF4917 family protein [Oligoflexus sp.]
MITFEDAFREAESNGQTSLLLGNGFSMALNQSIFSWASILENANLSASQKKLFSKFETKDFEFIIKLLNDASKLIDIYVKENFEFCQKIRNDAEEIKRALVNAITKNHYNAPYDIEYRKYLSCMRFLIRFHKIYTLNYDLLLYWTLMKFRNGDFGDLSGVLKIDDGFRDKPGEEYVIWKGIYDQSIFYLHGALHLFIGDTEIKKLTWNRTDITLKEQIESNMKDNYYPMYVSEGSTDEKKGRILRNGYLSKCFRSIKERKGSLFVFGATLSERDEHIVNEFAVSSTISSMYVGLYGDPDAANHQQTKIVCERAVQNRNEEVLQGRKRVSLKVQYFSSTDMNPWESFDGE